MQLRLDSDSGYIQASEALEFLLDAALIDTTGGYIRGSGTFFTYPVPDNEEVYYKECGYEPTDTIGKYYTFKKTKNYLVALSLSNDIFLLELTPENDLVRYDFRGHGAHGCCWNDFDDLLKKYGDYFGTITCGTGPAYCSAYITFFKDKILTENKSLPLSMFSGAWGEGIPGYMLHSIPELKDSVLVMHYTVEKFINDENDEMKIVSVDSFIVNYSYKNQGFETEEGYKLEGIPL